MTIELSEDSAQFVDEQVRAGRFPSAQAAIDAAVARLRTEPAVGEDVEELRALVDVGLAEADRGLFVEFTAEDVIAERRAAAARGAG